MNEIEAVIWERKRFAILSYYFDWKASLLSQFSDGLGSDNSARIRFHRGYSPSVACQRVGSDASAGAEVERLTPFLRKIETHRSPLRTRMVALCRFYQWIVVEARPHKRPLIGLMTKPQNGLLPR